MTPEVLHLCCHLDPTWGGLSQAVVGLSKAVAATGRYRVHLMALCAEDEQFTAPVLEGLRISRPPLGGLPGWPAMSKEIGAAMSLASLAHIHGLWQPHSILGARSARRHGVPYIMTAHGMLERWALKAKAWKKKAYALAFERRILSRAECLHALTDAEIGDFRRFGLDRPAMRIPNGVEAPTGVDPEPFWAKYPDLRTRQVVLFLGRIHVKKGIDLLCRAWGAVAHEHPNAHLVIAGPDTGNTRSGLETLVDRLGVRKQVTFTGLLSGEAKWSALRAASLFVLPSHSEGFSVAVLEALAVGCPAIITSQCNFPEIVASHAGWVIEPCVEDVTQALDEALRDSHEKLVLRGIAGKALIESGYSWRSVGRQMVEVYDRILNGGPQRAERYCFDTDCATGVES